MSCSKSLWFVSPKKVELREIETLPPPKCDELSIETIISAVSPGTELKVYRGEFFMDDTGNQPKNSTYSDLFQFPLKFGYSLIGKIIAVGNAVENLKIDQIIFAFHPHEEKFNILSTNVKLVPDGIPAEDAVFLPNVETAINLIHDGRPLLGEKIAIFGQGIVGLLTTYLLSQKNDFSKIYTFDSIEKRRQLSLELGAVQSLDPSNEISSVIPNGADLSFEVTGCSKALSQAIQATGYNGRIVVGSWYGSLPIQLELGDSFHRSHMNIIVSQVSKIRPELSGRWTKERRFDVAWDIIRKLKPSKFITHSVPFSEAPHIYKALDLNPTDIIQVVFNYH